MGPTEALRAALWLWEPSVIHLALTHPQACVHLSPGPQACGTALSQGPQACVHSPYMCSGIAQTPVLMFHIYSYI